MTIGPRSCRDFDLVEGDSVREEQNLLNQRIHALMMLRRRGTKCARRYFWISSEADRIDEWLTPPPGKGPNLSAKGGRHYLP